MSNYIECVFVNGNPTRYGKVLAYNVIEDGDCLALSSIQEVFYSHPDCPDVDLVVKEERTIMRASSGDLHYSLLFMAMMSLRTLEKIPSQ